LVETPLLFRCHRASSDRKSSSIRKLYHDTEQIPTTSGLAKNVVDGIFAERFGTLDERTSETDLFDFFRAYVVFSNVLDPVFRLYQLIDSHVLECT
jgi:hypothetical protein